MRRPRFASLALVAAVAAMFALIAACNGGDEESNIDVSEVDAAVLLEGAATRIESLETFHFDLDFSGGAANILGGINMREAEGDFAGIDNFQAKLSASVGPINADLEVRNVDGEGWITNPLTGRWEQEDISVGEVFDISSGVTALMRSVQDPTVVRAERVDGVDTYRVEAQLLSDELTLIPGARGGETLEAVAWIGVDDTLVRRIEVSGHLFDANESGTVSVRLSRFDEPITIEAPR
ncbi:MAG: LppX_LprAFG lipoprotein [Dehalococcoidia bacterium]